ncbi:internalin [Acinetobacter bereziniae]|uniref:internalin n=1 Tax=Acinetobacter bereziniae TaxID=106648 RepID=UPI0021E4240D|nr:internalin [Acinetobacter bereziniae]MCV2444041.1 internalin [Acinetobacter bereziniae]
MNKKFLICGAIATALLVSACVKKEEPKETEQEKVETAQTAASEPAQFESLPSAEQNTQQVEIPAHVEVERTETANTTTEIRREPTHEALATTQAAENKPTATEAKPAKAESVKTETAQTAPKTQTAPKANSGTAQSEDDAVAAAIAAATPALKN